MYLKFVNFGGNMIENNLDGKSKDIINSNIDLLKGIFPEIFEENKISFEKLKLILGEDINNENERYSFTWPGKTSAIKESQKQSRGTLRPNYEESRNWNTTKNIYIEGDNLEVLKLLQKGYYNKIKAIYIDPPYNTGNDFVYSDNYKDNLENYLKFSGQVIEDGEDMLKLSTNSDSNGRFHSNWLNMMYPRLKLARNLLTDDGFIFVSIDINESEDEGYFQDPYYDLFLAMAKKRGCIMSGGRIDEERFARLFLNDLREGRTGRITLEMPEDFK